MSSRSAWNKRWFGVWRESGAAYHACPSVKDFIDPAALIVYDRERLVRYLETAHVVAATSRMSFPCVVCGVRLGGSLSYRPDGEGLWLDDLGHYVGEHGGAPPPAMLERAAARGYEPPAVSQDEVERLEWPDCTG